METSTFKSTFKRLLLIQPQAIVRHPKKPLKRPSSVLVDESEIKQIPKAYWKIFCARHISWHTTKKRVLLQNLGLTHAAFFI